MWLLIAAVLVPVWAWSPGLLDAARFDGALLSLIALIAYLWKRPTPVSGTLPFAAFIFLGCLPLFIETSSSSFSILGGLVDRAPWLGAFTILCVGAHQSKALAKAWPWVLGGIFAAAGYGLLQLFGFDPFSWRPMSHSAPTAPLPGTNHAAEILAPALLAALALEWPRTLTARILLLVPVAFFLGSLHVFAAWVSLLIGMLFLLPWKKPQQLFILGFVLLAMAFGDSLGHFEESGSEPETVALPNNESQSETNVSIQVRWLTSLSVAQYAMTHPLGIGLGQYEKHHPHWQNPEILRVASHNFSDPATPRAKDPHNEALLAWVETGWLGFAFLLFCFFRLLRRPYRSTWTWAPLVAMAVHASVRSPFADNGASLAFAALLLASSSTTNNPCDSSGSPSKQGPFSRLLLGGFALLAGVAAVPQLAGEYFLSRSVLEGDLDKHEFTVEAQNIQRALWWRPWHAVAWDLEASRLSRLGNNPDQVRQALKNAISQDPADLFALTSLLKLEMLSGSPLLAHEYLIQAESFAAQHPSIREARTLWLEEMGTTQNRNGTLSLLENQKKARAHFLMGHSFLAFAAARRSAHEVCREELSQAAFYADQQRPLFERLARHEAPAEKSVRELLLRTLEDSGPYLGPESPED